LTGAQGEHFGPALRGVEAKTQVARLIGDGIIAAFFCQDKPKKRIERLVSFQKDIQSHLGSSTWSEAIEPYRASLRQGDLPITPFHWEIEFPESTILDDPSLYARARLNGNLELSRRINIVRHSRRAEITTLHEVLWMRPRVPPTPPM
jgi:hypothetical protein